MAKLFNSSKSDDPLKFLELMKFHLINNAADEQLAKYVPCTKQFLIRKDWPKNIKICLIHKWFKSK